MSKCRVNFVNGNFLSKDMNNLIDSITCETSDRPRKGETIVTRKIKGIVTDVMTDYREDKVQVWCMGKYSDMLE